MTRAKQPAEEAGDPAVDLDLLTRPFPPHAIKKREAFRGGPMLDYVEGHAYVHRLNDATRNRWDFRVISVESRDLPGEGNRLVTALVVLTLPGLGSRQHIGVQKLSDRGGEDLIKGAITDGLKKAASLFGVGLDLQGPDYEAGEVASPPAPPPKRKAPEARRMPASAPATDSQPASQPKEDAAAGQYGWTEFWPWARSLGLNGPQAVEKFIGRPTAGLAAAELRDLINAKQGG